MKNLETSDWLVLNNIIYKIYTTEDIMVMRNNLLEQLTMILNFDSADFFLANEDGKKGLINPVSFNCELDRAAQYDELDYSRGIMYGGKSMVYRETDIIGDEKRIKSEYYQKVYKPNNWHYSIQMILAREKQFLGVITLYRTIGKENFQYDDVFLLDMLKDHLSFRMFNEKAKGDKIHCKLSITETVIKYQLTKREEVILRLLLKGLHNDKICDELVISVNTLKKHVLNIYRKLGINNRVQMFMMIRENDN